jgi:flagellar biosynthesis/type III secretory pathway protein FliH
MRAVFPEGEAMMGTIAEKWIEQGVQRGLEQGLELGREQGLEQGLRTGREEGRRQGLLDAIELDLDSRFGSDAQQLFAEIAEITDVDVLKAIFARTKQASSPDELRRIWRQGAKRERQ